MLPKSLILSLIGVLLVAFSVFAGTSVIEGVVKDGTGRPIKGADIRIEAKIFPKFLRLIPEAITLPMAWQLVPIRSRSLSMGKSKHRSPTPRHRWINPHSSTSI